MSQSLYVCGHQIAPETLARRVTLALERRFGVRGVVGVERPDPEALVASDIAIVLIDQGWTRSSASMGWLDDPADLTRGALIAATQEGKVILPLLLDGTPMPDVEDLPDELRFLHFRNAQTISAGATFDSDMARVIETLEETRRGRGFAVQASATALATGLWFVLIFVMEKLAAFTAFGQQEVVRALFRSVRETSIIAFTPLALAALIFGARLLLMRRWTPATVLLACATLLTEEMSRPITVSGYVAPWSAMPWTIALLTGSALLPLSAVTLVALGLIAAQTGRLRYSHVMVTARQRHRAGAEALAAGTTWNVFVSCRAEDMSATYQRLCAFIERYLTGEPGQNRALLRPMPNGYTDAAWKAALDSSPNVLVIMGPHWRGANGAGMSDSNDPIRRQLAEALRAGKSLIPVLIDGAQMPALATIPPELSALCFERPIRVGASYGWASGFFFNNGYNLVATRLLGVPGSYIGLLIFVLDAWFFHYYPDVFLSYRRADSAVMCGRIHRALSRRRRLGGRVFRDTDAISAGVDFSAVLLDAIESSDVLLALIGPQWLSIVGPSGARRLDDPDDMVRREVETALREKKIVIPVLLDDTPMPDVADLPGGLAPLASLTPLRVRSGRGFAHDIARLTAEARRYLGIERHPMLAALSALTTASAAAVLYGMSHWPDGLAYLLQRNPQWCAQTPVQLCYVGPNMGVADTLGALLVVAFGGASVALLSALWLMTRRKQSAMLVVLYIYLLLAGLLVGGVITVFAGRLPAVVPIGHFGGASYSNLTVYALGTVLLQSIIIAALALTWYFWRSQGAPHRSATSAP